MIKTQIVSIGIPKLGGWIRRLRFVYCFYLRYNYLVKP